jgi:hypothetical protein
MNAYKTRPLWAQMSKSRGFVRRYAEPMNLIRNGSAPIIIPEMTRGTKKNVMGGGGDARFPGF